MLGSQDECGICASIYFMTEDGRDEVGSLRKVPINGADADAGLFCDFSHPSVYSRGREHRQRRLQQRVRIPLRVGARADPWGHDAQSRQLLALNSDPAFPWHSIFGPRLPCVQDGSQRYDARHGARAGFDRDQGQRLLPGLHQNEPQQL